MNVAQLPSLTLVTDVPDTCDVLVLGLADAAGKPSIVGASDILASEYAQKYGACLEEVAQSLGGSSKLGATAVLPSDKGVIVVTGVGEADVTPTLMRKAAAHAIKRALAISGTRSIKVAVSLETNDPEVAAATAEGALLACYRYVATGTPAPAASVSHLDLVAPHTVAEAVGTAQVTCEAVCLARDWVNSPANLLTPALFATSAKEAVRGTKIDVETMDEKALAKEGFGGIVTVGGGSSNPPRLVRMTWAPKDASAHVAFVGKGMTFDSGGLNLKPAESMYTMKCDMAGAAAVLAAMRAIAALNVPVKVTCIAVMAENMPSGDAYRPSDVLTLYSGKTVENGNCDAEGRLCLADGLTLAAQAEPDLMIDVATLTGAMVVALGERTSGLMASDDETADLLLDASIDAGENFWHMPIPDEMDDMLKSDVADLKSTGARWGGGLSAAAFLRNFVPDDTAWAHLDIAGTAFCEKPYDEVAKGGTGVAVRTLIAVTKSLA